jgi:heme exporter protein A
MWVMNRSYSPDDLALSVSNLRCSRADIQIIENLSFEAQPGQVVLLRGANGAGKSTVLMCLANLLYYEGNIEIRGGKEDISPNEMLHFISHLPALKPNLTITDNLEFWAELNDGDKEKIPAALISARLDHAAKLDASNLSAGQTRRLSLLRLLVAHRPIWLLDEPTSALDSQGEKWICDQIDDHIAQNGIAIIATHLDLPLNAIPKTIHIGAPNHSEVAT